MFTTGHAFLLAACLVVLVLLWLVSAVHVVVLPPTWAPWDLASVLLAASALVPNAVGAIVAWRMSRSEQLSPGPGTIYVPSGTRAGPGRSMEMR